MSQLKNKIKRDIVDPASKTKKTSILIGEVTTSSISNRCGVDFVDVTGSKFSNKFLPIRIYGNNPWLPKKGEKVLIEQHENEYSIISKYVESTEEFGKDNVLKADIYSNLVLGGLLGLIY